MNKLPAIALLFLLPAPLWAQDNKLSRTNLSDALPAQVLTAIQNAASTKTIYPVTGNETFRDQILKADEIVFDSGATLTLTALDKPWIVLIANRWKFTDPKNMVKILRARRLASRGNDGSAGTHGADNPGETNRRGNDGGSGESGGSGGSGGTLQLPKIYLVGGSFTSPSGEPLPLRLTLDFAGVTGGDGGEGGAGGNGGNAGSGKEGATSAFDCKEGPGPGGNGGSAGAGGAGGDGGRGGSGADITYIALAEGIEQISYVRVMNVEGYGGMAGRPGRAGRPGNGGDGASSNGWCGPSGSGYPGDFPKPADLGQGNNGPDGKKGVVTAITVGSLSPIFKE